MLRPISLLVLLLLPSGPSQPDPSRTVRVSVTISEVRPAVGGVLRIGLHRDPGTGFPGPSSFENLTRTADAASIVVTFEVPPGGYAVAVHHDANANGRLDGNFLGIPREGYGVSNDARPRFSAPKFRAARVVVTRDTALAVRLHY